MILAIDVGNTNIAIGCIDNGMITHVFRLSTNTKKTADECAADIKNILDFHGLLQHGMENLLSNSNRLIDGAAISCVVPPLTSVFKDAVKLLAGVDAVVVGAGVKTGVNILIDDPGQLGGDMAATAVGALASYSPPLIIIDMGTATKMYVLDKKGRFLGGAIAPGLALSMDALAAGTSQLPQVPLEAPAKCTSTNTVECMKSGAVFGAAAMIDGMTGRFEAELGERAQIILTGGLAGAVYHHCKRDVVYDPHLILRGLGIIYDKNNSGAGNLRKQTANLRNSQLEKL